MQIRPGYQFVILFHQLVGGVGKLGMRSVIAPNAEAAEHIFSDVVGEVDWKKVYSVPPESAGWFWGCYDPRLRGTAQFSIATVPDYWNAAPQENMAERARQWCRSRGCLLPVELPPTHFEAMLLNPLRDYEEFELEGSRC